MLRILLCRVLRPIPGQPGPEWCPSPPGSGPAQTVIRNPKQTPLVEKRCSAFLPLTSQFPGISLFHWLIHLFLAGGGRQGRQLFQKSCSCWCPRILFFSSPVYLACHSPSRDSLPSTSAILRQVKVVSTSSQRGLSSENSSHLSSISHSPSSPLSWVLPPDWPGEWEGDGKNQGGT